MDHKLEIRWDDEAQSLWNDLIRAAFGPDGLTKRARRLAPDGTMLGLMTPHRHRIYGVD